MKLPVLPTRGVPPQSAKPGEGEHIGERHESEEKNHSNR